MEDLFSNDVNKIIFLKAILLGINYGKSDKVSFYKENIELEIIKLSKEISKNNTENKTLHNQTVNNHIVNNTQTNNQNENNNSKYEKNIELLNNQKKITLNLIQNLSSNNYSYNYSRINILRNNLIQINQEIEKNKFILFRNKNKNKKNQNHLQGELERTLGSLSNLIVH